MNQQTADTSKAREKQVAEEIWLNYFNNYLLEHGVITEREHRKMIALILGRRQTGASRKTKP